MKKRKLSSSGSTERKTSDTAEHRFKSCPGSKKRVSFAAQVICRKCGLSGVMEGECPKCKPKKGWLLMVCSCGSIRWTDNARCNKRAGGCGRRARQVN